ncbi:NAD-dependent epimerase/dehydratase family protein [Kiloniella sp.]|uniref:NAD-dependent epimerase/dehydratase family protein n=1 Tax=Kiloniella sp. TaxID=1938587 RepID=UPI003B013017
MKILVIGGTRFFGKELVSKLGEQGHEVTIVSRGNQKLPTSKALSHILADRDDLEGPLNELGTYWDVVYDQICYCSNDAAATLRAIEGKAGKLIIASSEAVYENGLNKHETDFDPSTFSYETGSRSDFSYAEGKRNAEGFLFQNANLSVIAARIPFVLGIDDYTKRLEQIIKAVAKGEPIYVPSLGARLSMISSSEIASALCNLKEVDFDGPLNIAPKTPISTGYLLNQIENIVGKKAQLEDSPEVGLISDFLTSSNRSIDPSRLEEYGIEISAIDTWLSTLIREIASQEVSSPPANT